MERFLQALKLGGDPRDERRALEAVRGCRLTGEELELLTGVREPSVEGNEGEEEGAGSC